MTIRPTFRDLEAVRGNNFDALRVAFALLVILSHSYPLLSSGSNHREPLVRLSGDQLSFGAVGVNGFFLISGYLITASWQRSRGVLDYLRRRALRIYPGFLVAVAFSSFVAGPLLVADASAYWHDFDFKRWPILAFLLIGAYSPGIETNGSLWSIRYEFLCYLGVATLGMARLLRWPILLLGMTLACTAVHAFQLHWDVPTPGDGPGWLRLFRGFWPRVAACFLAGAIFHLWGYRVVRSNLLAIIAAAGLVAATLLTPAKLLPLVFPYLAGYLTFWVAFTPLGRLKEIARYGDFTYGLYLYAFPVQLLLIKAFAGAIHPLALALVATLVTAIPAALSWHFVEKPCLRWKPSSRTGQPAEEKVA